MTPPLVNVTDQHYGNIRSLGKAHIGEITLAQIGFSRAASTFHENDIVLFTQLFEALEDGRHELFAAIEKVLGLTSWHRVFPGQLSVRHDQTRFEQHRVHMDCRLHLRSAGL